MFRLFVPLVLAACLIATVGAASAGATTTPGVSATPYNNGSHPWSTDGCSVVPDSGSYLGAYWNFNHACIHHDGCCRLRWASRSTCDSWFLNDMRASCGAIHPRSTTRRTLCGQVTWTYYTSVRAFGSSAYTHRSWFIPIKIFA